MEIVIPRINKKYYVPIAIGCIAVIFLANLALQNIINSPERVFSKYIKLQRVQNYKRSYKICFSSGYKKMIKPSGFENIQKGNTALLGFTIDKQIIKKKKLRTKDGRDIYAITSMAFYPTGAVPENYFFIKEFNGWRIDAFDIQSPLLDPAEKKRMKDFFNKLTKEEKEPFKRMLHSQGRSI